MHACCEVSAKRTSEKTPMRKTFTTRTCHGVGRVRRGRCWLLAFVKEEVVGECEPVAALDWLYSMLAVGEEGNPVTPAMLEGKGAF